MKLIFLDIDGVLNSSAWLEDQYKKGRSVSMVREFDRAAIGNLNRVVLGTGAKVVISSTWRLLYSLDHITGMLLDFGFKGVVIDKTPEIFRGARGYEIEKWMKEHRVTPGQVVILDDSSDMGDLGGRRVLVSSRWGLTQGDAKKAIKLLQG